MNILVTGGTGFIGTALVEKLTLEGHCLVLLSQHPGQASPSVTYVKYPDPGSGLPACLLKEIDAIINLAGHSIAAKSRWDSQTKEFIVNSRIHTTLLLIDSLKHCAQQGLPYPKTFITTSAIGYYGPCPQGPVTEASPKGPGFLANVCQQWEEAALQAQDLDIAVVRLRFGIVLGPQGGMLERMEKPFHWGLGGIIGSKNNWISWIHRSDLIQIINHFVHQPAAGIFNVVAPNPVKLGDFGERLGQALRRKSWTVFPSWLARLLLGQFAEEILLCSQQVLPVSLLQANFIFQYPTLDLALEEIYATD